MNGIDARFVVLGGAGFVGSTIAQVLRAQYPRERVLCVDNLKRRGSECNLPLLRAAGIDFVHGDLRTPEDLAGLNQMEWLFDCCAEPSVMAGRTNPQYVIQTNFNGTVHALELARKHHAKFMFLSTSRVYPMAALNALPYRETPTRYDWELTQPLPGLSADGIGEDFPLTGSCSLYGASKRASENLIEEYAHAYGVSYVINRCGVIAGPGQFGKPDQGVFTYWLLHHLLNRPLAYLGYGGTGKQVRDLLHVRDLADLVVKQVASWPVSAGQTFCVGGGPSISLSLLEATQLCREVTGRTVPITPICEERPDDVRIFLTDASRVGRAVGWRPQRGVQTIFKETCSWLEQNINTATTWLGN